MTPSLRAEIVTRRTYNRPLPDGKYETWAQTVARVIRHQRWLWEGAKSQELGANEERELQTLASVIERREGALAGRTLWLGGTEISRTRAASGFNCCGILVKTVFDVVDVVWLLLQGCGVGFVPVTGVLNGFIRPIPEIEIIRSTRTTKGGGEQNTETWLHESRTWIIQVGDSAVAWAKALGKLVAGKYPARKLVIDLSQIRPAGDRLKGYGWISSGDHQLALALDGICRVLNASAGRLLTVIDIMDIVNWAGSILSSRRSAEMTLLSADHDDLDAFATAKRDHFSLNPQRAQSNNSVVFHRKPDREELEKLFDMMVASGGSEPGIVNGAEAKKRAPDFATLNPCGEAILGDKSLCNLSEINLSAFNGRFPELLETATLLARANYRQTCVDLRDGVLQHTWHELNQYLHLCGVGITGYVQWEYQGSKHHLRQLYQAVRDGTDGMADELDLPRSKRVSVVKPSGTLSKVFDCTEGVHKPLGRYIFNNINFSAHDPLVGALRDANYRVSANPYDSTGVIVAFPVWWPGVDFGEAGGKDVNTDTAIDQLERYRTLMESFVDQNVSITVHYTPDEIPDIIDWLMGNWDGYVAVSFLPRIDPTKTAQDLGYPYLPQEVVTEQEYSSYLHTLRPVLVDRFGYGSEIDVEECAGGACPVR